MSQTFWLLYLTIFLLTIDEIAKAQFVFDVEQCPSEHCKNGGVCHVVGASGSNKFVCQCKDAMYWGSRCQHQMGDLPCKDHKCKNGAICDSDGYIQEGDTTYNYACRCTNDFAGPFCTTPKLLLMCRERHPCNENSLAIVKDKQCACECKEHYTGQNCETALPCATMLCEHNGKCYNAKCNCTGTYYTGDRCETIDRDQLPEGSKKLCTGELKCHHGAQCTIGNSADGSLIGYCNCSEEWRGNKDCSAPFDPCQATYFDNYCLKNKDKCGWKEDKSPSPCAHGTCKAKQNTSASIFKFECKCEPGFMGRFCDTVDPCHKHICPTKNHQCVLVPSVDGYSVERMCECKANHTGAFCNKIIIPTKAEKICERHKCKNNSTCVPCLKIPGVCKTAADRKRKYICSCDQRQTGEFCEKQLDPCFFHQCRNKAKCKSESNYSYKCECEEGVVGLHCEIILDICSLRSPCQAGSCYLTSDTEYGYRCNCKDGKHGYQCEIDDYKIFGLYLSRSSYATFWSFVASIIGGIALFTGKFSYLKMYPPVEKKRNKRQSSVDIDDDKGKKKLNKSEDEESSDEDDSVEEKKSKEKDSLSGLTEVIELISSEEQSD